jgi:hypothetical protein
VSSSLKAGGLITVTIPDAVTSEYNGASDHLEALPAAAAPLIWKTSNESCDKPITEHQADLRNVCIAHGLIIALLIIILIANAREGERYA